MKCESENKACYVNIKDTPRGEKKLGHRIHIAKIFFSRITYKTIMQKQNLTLFVSGRECFTFFNLVLIKNGPHCIYNHYICILEHPL